MLLARPSLMRTSARSLAGLGRNPSQQFARRTYAATHEVKKSSDLPWLVLVQLRFGVAQHVPNVEA
jgi:hypothetical protein